jgi:hypothetical protein
MAETNRPLAPYTFTVTTAVGEARHHPFQSRAVNGLAIKKEDAGDAAHSRLPQHEPKPNKVKLFDGLTVDGSSVNPSNGQTDEPSNFLLFLHRFRFKETNIRQGNVAFES